MLGISFYQLHIQGGPIFMFPLSLMFVVNICIFIYVLIAAIQKKPFNMKWLEAIKQIGAMAAVFGALSTLIGLMQAFDWLENHKEGASFQVIMGGMKVAVITALYGLIIFCLSLLAYIVLKLTSQTAKA